MAIYIAGLAGMELAGLEGQAAGFFGLILFLKEGIEELNNMEEHRNLLTREVSATSAGLGIGRQH